MLYLDIIDRIKASDRDAFDLLCRERYAAMLSYARLFVRDDIAQDIVQDVLFNLWQRREHLDRQINIQAYLLKSVYNRCMNSIDSDKRAGNYADFCQERIAQLTNSYLSPDNNPVILGMYNSDLKIRLEKAISELSPRCREVFTMGYVDHMSEREISERLGLSLSTVENHMYAALKQLRASLANF